MKRILLTGISGTGKSTVIKALADRGYKAVDTDYDGYSEWVTVDDDSHTPGEPVEANRDWVWQEERIQALLADEDADTLFVSGSSPNMGKFLPQFDCVILLSAPPDVIVERLTTRTSNPYGQHPDEIRRVLGMLDTVEPLLRRVADHEIDTDRPLEDVVAAVLQLAGMG